MVPTHESYSPSAYTKMLFSHPGLILCCAALYAQVLVSTSMALPVLQTSNHNTKGNNWQCVPFELSCQQLN